MKMLDNGYEMKVEELNTYGNKGHKLCRAFFYHEGGKVMVRGDWNFCCDENNRIYQASNSILWSSDVTAELNKQGYKINPRSFFGKDEIKECDECGAIMIVDDFGERAHCIDCDNVWYSDVDYDE